MEPCHNVQVPSSSLSIFGSKTSHFELFHTKKTYPEAKADCESRNQRLAIVKTPEAYLFLVDIGKYARLMLRSSAVKTDSKYISFHLKLKTFGSASRMQEKNAAEITPTPTVPTRRTGQTALPSTRVTCPRL